MSSSKESVVLIIDTGVSVAQKPDNASKSFLDLSLEAASVIVERRLFQESKDDVAVILVGSAVTNNSLGYEGVNVIERGLAPADWDLITFLREHVEASDEEPDWLDGVTVACDLLKRESGVEYGKNKYTEMSLILFSDMASGADLDQLDVIIKGMNMLEKVTFTCVCPDSLVQDEDDETGDNGDTNDNPYDNPQPSTSRGEPSKLTKKRQLPKKPVTLIQKQNREALIQFVNARPEHNSINGIENDILEQLLFRKKRMEKPWPWKVMLEISSDIRINTTGFCWKRREKPKAWKRCLAKGGEEELQAVTKYYRDTGNDEDEQEEVTAEEVIMGYRFGQEIVSISEDDEEAAKFDGGPKSMKLFGFLSRDQLRMHQFVGDGCMAFMPSEGDGNSIRAWSALISAMQELNMVAVVRKVYNRNSAPRLGALIPEENEEGEVFLCYVELPFAEDIKQLEFPSLPTVSDEQQNLMDNLVDCMSLVQEFEDGGVLDVLDQSQVMDPSTQYLFQSLSFRARNPGRVLPAPGDHILNSLMSEQQAEIDRCSAPVLERIKEKFSTKINEKALNKRKRSDNDEDETAKRARTAQDDVTEVGTVTPVEDFRFLLSHTVSNNTTFATVSHQLESVIINLLNSTFAASINNKVLACLTVYREECISRRSPQLYNEFMKKVKSSLGDNTKLLLDVAEDNLGLILDSEAPGGVEQKDAGEFLIPPDVNN